MPPETIWKTRFLVGLLGFIVHFFVPTGYVTYNNCAQLTGEIYDVILTGSCLSIRDPNPYGLIFVLSSGIPLILMVWCAISTRQGVRKESIPTFTKNLAKLLAFYFLFFRVIGMYTTSPLSPRWTENGITVLSWFPIAGLIELSLLVFYAFLTFEHPRLKALDFRKFAVPKGKRGEIVIQEKWAAPVRKSILELGVKFTRLQIAEIAERVKGLKENQIIAVVEDMIRKGQIVAEYFKSTRSVAFDQQANTQALAKFIGELDGQFTEWGKDGKKV